MSRRISFCYPMDDTGCKYQTQLPPADEEASSNLIAVGKLLLPKNPSKRDLEELLETLYPEVECRPKMKNPILNELKSDSKPGCTETTCCIEHIRMIMKDGCRNYLSQSMAYYTVTPMLRYFHDKADYPGSKTYLTQIGHQKLTFRSSFYPGAFRPLKDVDRISDDIEKIRRLLGTHKSQPGWNRPRTHRFHLLNFPKGGAFVTPTVVNSNCSESYSEADFRISFPESPYYNEYKSFESGLGVTLRENVGPRPGFPDSAPYVELTRVLRPIIDATCFRTCKQIWDLGSQILYADNAYSFKMKGDGMKLYDSPPSLLSEDGNYHWPNPDKPILSHEGISDDSALARQYNSKIKHVMNQIERGVPVLKLKGWAYYDPFLRFLYTIGPQSRASIRTLRFTGAPKTHVREAQGCHCHGVDLLHNLRTYIPFINKFCTSVIKLVLDMDMDVCATMSSLENAVRSFDEVLIPFLSELEKLQKVRTLVMRSRVSPKDSFYGRILYEDIDYAKVTINSFRSRVENKVRVGKFED
ncbi:hypothetical protein EAF00_003849 [Botryotinia globosa]|nr:hypothetical protein EAF00_003849 [Botryotinia globosa]